MVERLSKAVQELLNDKDFTERRAKQGDVAPPWASPAEFGRFLAVEDERYRQLATGLKLE